MSRKLLIRKTVARIVQKARRRRFLAQKVRSHKAMLLMRNDPAILQIRVGKNL